MSLFASLLALDVPRPVITVEYLTECQKRPAARFNKDAPCMTMYEAWRAVQNVPRPFRNHWEIPPWTTTHSSENLPTESSQNSDAPAHCFKYPTVLSGATNAKTASADEPKSTTSVSTHRPGLATTLPSRNSQTTSVFPTRLSSTISPVPLAPQLLSVLVRLDIPESWWRWTATDRQRTSIAARKTVMICLRESGMSYSEVARTLNMKHSTVMWALCKSLRDKRHAKPASTPSDGEGSLHP